MQIISQDRGDLKWESNTELGSLLTPVQTPAKEIPSFGKFAPDVYTIFLAPFVLNIFLFNNRREILRSIQNGGLVYTRLIMQLNRLNSK
jgi:hypothetical protein